MKPKDKKVGHEILAYIKKNGIKQIRIAERLKVNPSLFNEMLMGKRNLSIEVAFGLEDNFIGKAEVWLQKQFDYEIAAYKKMIKSKRK